MANVEKVIQFARQSHAGQLYKNLDYFDYHVCGIMGLVQENYSVYGVTPQISMLLNTVAILSKIEEKTHKSFVDIFNILQEAEYTSNEVDVVVRSLMLLSKDEYEDAEAHIENLLEDTCARFVSKAAAEFDLREAITDGDYENAKKHLKVLCTISLYEQEN